ETGYTRHSRFPFVSRHTSIGFPSFASAAAAPFPFSSPPNLEASALSTALPTTCTASPAGELQPAATATTIPHTANAHRVIERMITRSCFQTPSELEPWDQARDSIGCSTSCYDGGAAPANASTETSLHPLQRPVRSKLNRQYCGREAP